MLIPVLFVVSTNVAKVFGVVMMAPQNTYKHAFSSTEVPVFDETLLPLPYNMSSPITSVLKYKLLVNDPRAEWINAWKYQGENVTVFATQGSDLFMDNRFIIDQNIGDTGISIYAVFDGYGGNYTVDRLAYKMMDALRTKILSIRSGAYGYELVPYVNPDESINFQKLIHDEVLVVEKHLNYLSQVHEIKSKALYPWEHSESGSTVLLAVIQGDRLTVANTGNSRAVMCNVEGGAVPLTHVHVFHSNFKEQDRCLQMGGTSLDWEKHYGLSRIVGDLAYKQEKKCRIPDPEVFVYDLSKRYSEFLVLATNSIWYGVGNVTNEQQEQILVSRLHKHINDDPKLLETMINTSVHQHRQGFFAGCRVIMVVKTPRRELQRKN